MSCPYCGSTKHVSHRRKIGKIEYWIEQCLRCKLEWGIEPIDFKKDK